MRKMLLVTSFMVLAAGSGMAVAQPIPPAPDAAVMPPPPPDGPDRGVRPPPPGSDIRGPAGGPARISDHVWMPPPPPGGPRGPMPPPSPGAHFHVERGGNVVDVKCADDQPMQACAAIAEQLLTEGRKL
jgi:hypothetical protein